MVNKLSRATDSSISPGLINKLYGIYISFPWFRFTHMDLALRVLFHRFQIIFDRMRLTFSVAVGTIKINIKCITAVSTINIPKPRQSCLWTYKIYKLLVSPNERLNNIILERTFECNTTQPQNSTAKESNATSEIESTWKWRPKYTWPTHVLTCSSQVITCLSYGTSLLAMTCS